MCASHSEDDLCIAVSLPVVEIALFSNSRGSRVVVPAVATPVPAVPVLVAMALAVMDLAAPIVAGPTLFKTPPLL